MTTRITRAAVTSALLCGIAIAQQRPIVVIAHRGEHLHHPENTIPAFTEAIRLGADFIEVDVRTTSDGKLVLMHDSTVDRCTTSHGEIAKMTFDEVRALDAGVKRGPEFAGTKVPTFDEALELARGKIGVYVDVKRAPVKDLTAAIERHGMVDHVVIYGDMPYLGEVATLNPALKVMPESDNVEVATKLIQRLHPKVVAFGARDWLPDVIRIVKQAGAQLYVDRMGFTDNTAGWQSAIDDGADGIQTDRPGELVAYLRSKR